MVTVDPAIIHARSDLRDWLVEADEPLAGLQLGSGGSLPGLIASPALLELVRKARAYGLKLARPIQAQDHAEQITAWAEIEPVAEGCRIRISSWHTRPLADADPQQDRKAAIASDIAELAARLGPGQEIIAVENRAEDLAELATRMQAGAGRPWTDFVAVAGKAPQQPMHWRLLDGVAITAEGSDREWKAHLRPLGRPVPGSAGFELYLVAEQPLPDQSRVDTGGTQAAVAQSASMGREVAPVLRQPVARIIANAETIKAQLAGPLAEEYSNYAADIAAAGEHLLALIEDITVLEVVEREEFTPAPDRIELTDLARRAAGILGVRAAERGISIDLPKGDEQAPAIGEFRRVLQILLNLLGNAIRYAPEGSQIWMRVSSDGDRARIVVADQGEGLSEDQQARMFEKFERLGRSGDGGSGLGLYISRRLARAMQGELSVESAPGQGARFILELPADEG